MFGRKGSSNALVIYMHDIHVNPLTCDVTLFSLLALVFDF